MNKNYESHRSSLFARVVIVALSLIFGTIGQASAQSTQESTKPGQTTSKESTKSQDEVTARSIMILYDRHSPDLAFTLTWAGDIALSCDKANIPWHEVDVRTKTMTITNSHTENPETPVDPAQLPQWLIDDFKTSLSQGSVILQAYGSKNGRAVRHPMTRSVGSIPAPGRAVNGSLPKDIAQFIEEIKQAPSSAWVDIAKAPNKSAKDLEKSALAAEQAQSPIPTSPSPAVAAAKTSTPAIVHPDTKNAQPAPSVDAPREPVQLPIPFSTDAPSIVINKETSMPPFTDIAIVVLVLLFLLRELRHPRSWNRLKSLRVGLLTASLVIVSGYLATRPARSQLQVIDLRDTQVTSTGLKYLQGSSVTSVSLSGRGITNEELRALQGQPITALTLEDTWVTAIGLKSLRGLPITSLTLTGKEITDDEFKALVGLPIKSLTLQGTSITNDGFKFIQELPVTAVALSDNARITDDGLKALQNLPITNLSLKGSQLTSKGLKAIHGLPITDLDLTGIDLSNQELEFLEGLPLKTLRLKGTALTDQELKVLQELPIANFALYNNTVRTITFERMRGKYPTKVNLSGYLIYPEMLEFKPLKGEGPKYVSGPGGSESPSGLKLKIPQGTAIENLALSNVWFSDGQLGFRRLQGALPIDTLSLSTAALKDEDIKTLHRLPIAAICLSFAFTEKTNETKQFQALHGLPITGLSLTGKWIQGLSGLQGLPITTLRVSGTSITSGALSALKGLPITSLDLSGTNVSDDDLKALSGLPITNLNLSKTPIHGSGFKGLGLPVTSLDLSNNTRITLEGYKALQELPLRYLNLRGTEIGDSELKSIIQPPSGNELLEQFMLIAKWAYGLIAVAIAIRFLIRYWNTYRTEIGGKGKKPLHDLDLE